MKPDRETKVFLGLVAFSLLGSFFTMKTHLDPGPIAPVASVLTLASGLWAAFRPYLQGVDRPWRRILIALLLGTGAELVGLGTGFPFGRYAYTDRWWPTVGLPGLGPFPLLLPFAWLLMAGSAVFTASTWLKTWPWWSPALLGGLMAALVDLGMEPVMAGRLGYWRWLEVGPLPGGAAAANFFGWWAVASLAGGVLTFRAAHGKNGAAAWVLGGFVVLVAGLGVVG